MTRLTFGLISLAALGFAMLIARPLAVRFGIWNAILLAAGAFIVIIVVAQLLLPDINEVPDQFPAIVLWRFRIVSLGIQLILWTTFGLLFGVLAERVLSKTSAEYCNPSASGAKHPK